MRELKLNSQKNFLLGLSVYVLWGFFPLYFSRLAPAGAFEVIAHRAIWGLIFCLSLMACTGRLRQLLTLWKDKRTFWFLVLAGHAIVINWGVYVWAILHGHTVDAALGYFINPLVTVFLAATVRHERLNALQASSLALGAIAIIVMIAGLGYVPWVSIGLPVTFGVYSLIKKQVSTTAPVVTGMALETMAVAPLLIAYFVYLVCTRGTSFHKLARHGAGAEAMVGHFALLVGAGLVTVIPLIMFAMAARGLSLTVLGLLQYTSPIMQLLIGVFIFHEPMEPARWVGTLIIWLGLMLLTWDSLRSKRHPHA
ncbi:EamA family transporter RarD [Gleimia hominis]|uniref:EamA family transporter RarD n=1 Tax=Gleimia hominis TaxID=595468 RepID=UPI000C8074AD|nr:EamA family transporter RarD [Gleimia hominis]WIK64443.1 EamA family transporter RarD [Gleimia hominis]